jgi:hypothetical protein
MKKLIQYLSVGIISATLAMSTAFAGECCKKAAAAAKEGKLCAKCMKEDAHGCCKKAAEAAGKEVVIAFDLKFSARPFSRRAGCFLF